MIIRIVKMTLNPDMIDIFKENFTLNMLKIRNFEGCTHLELLQDENTPNILMTYSFWNSVESLNKYRDSELFKGIWKTVKPMFIDQTQAWSLKQEFKL